MKGVAQRRATIVDVAKQANVSKSTVARVLEGKINVSDDARARVLKAVAALGYERNRLAVGMRFWAYRIAGDSYSRYNQPFLG